MLYNQEKFSKSCAALPQEKRFVNDISMFLCCSQVECGKMKVPWLGSQFLLLGCVRYVKCLFFKFHLSLINRLATMLWRTQKLLFCIIENDWTILRSSHTWWWRKDRVEKVLTGKKSGKAEATCWQVELGDFVIEGEKDFSCFMLRFCFLFKTQANNERWDYGW